MTVVHWQGSRLKVRLSDGVELLSSYVDTDTEVAVGAPSSDALEAASFNAEGTPLSEVGGAEAAPRYGEIRKIYSSCHWYNIIFRRRTETTQEWASSGWTVRGAVGPGFWRTSSWKEVSC